MRKTIVCLANSYKHGGRCIAGVSIDDGAWIRLRGKALDGALCACEYALDDGSEPRLLDVIEVELHYAVPSDAHPEDWQIAPTQWHLVERPASPARMQMITAAADKVPTVLRGYRDRMAVGEVDAKPLLSSLVLVCPDQLHWWIREDGGKRRHRALFQRHHVTYDFALTDPLWIEQFKPLPAGIYPHSDIVDSSDETWLTISLSEPYFGFHYKLVAGVIVRIKAEPPSSRSKPCEPKPPVNPSKSSSSFRYIKNKFGFR